MVHDILIGLGASLKTFAPSDFLENARWFDWGILFLLVLGTVYGASKGLWREFVKLIWIIFIIFIVMDIYPEVSEFLKQQLKMETKFSIPAGYIITLSLTVLSVILIDGYLLKTMHTTVIPTIKITGGLIFGLINSLLVIGLLVQTVYLWPFIPIKRFFQEGSSYMAYLTVDIVPKAYEVIVQPIEMLRKSTTKAKEDLE